MIGWLGAKTLFGLSRFIWIGVGLLIIFALWLWLDARETADDKNNQEIGARLEREASTGEVIKRVEKGNEVRETVRPGSNAAYDECMLSARTPENCVGLLPEREGDQLRTGSE